MHGLMKEPKGEKTNWIGYSQLAWIEPIIAPPQDYAQETKLFIKTIRKNSNIEPRTLLHLGCGAGGNDHTFKKYFAVTGVDISKDMLQIAKKHNPEVTYYHQDMRLLNLDACFDAVAIPDSIGYMTTAKELRKVVLLAQRHLKPGGVLLIVGQPKEDFRENNFLYTGKKGDREITVFENNHIRDPQASTYEATIIYLVRKKGKLEMYSECHILGLFKKETWFSIFKDCGLKVREVNTKEAYGPFIFGQGSYLLTIFACTKPFK